MLWIHHWVEENKYWLIIIKKAWNKFQKNIEILDFNLRQSKFRKCFYIEKIFNYPSMIMASRVVSAFSSGLPPYPTVPSHCMNWQVWQPLSTASKADSPFCKLWKADQKKKTIKIKKKKKKMKIKGCLHITIFISFNKVPSIHYNRKCWVFSCRKMLEEWKHN